MIADVLKRVAVANEPFIVPDVTPPGCSPAAVFHVLRDLCDDGVLSHSNDGYRIISSTPREENA